MRLLMLNEATLEDIKKRIPYLMPKLTSQQPELTQDQSLEILRKIASADPTKGKYVPWLLTQYLEGNFRLDEDERKINHNLSTFHKIKNRLTKKDINQYRTPGELARELDNVQASKRKVKQASWSGKLGPLPDGAEHVLTKDALDVVKVTDPKAATILSSGTEWCTANLKHANYYLQKGPLYLVYLHGKRTYLVHYETNQFKDIYDDPVGNTTQLSLINLLEPATGHSINNNPHLALWYAQKVFGGRWPEGEEVIRQHPETAYDYALGTLRHRWPEAEETIMKDPHTAVNYATKVLKRRWPEAEDIIKQNPHTAVKYIANLTKRRWPEAEETIKQNPHTASYYATKVVKRRWPEAEEIIKQNAYAAAYYAIEVLKRRWPEAEETIMKDPHTAANYATKVLKRRWPEAEEIIMKDPKAKERYFDGLPAESFKGSNFND